MDYEKNNNSYDIQEADSIVYVNPLIEVLWTHPNQTESQRLTPEPCAVDNQVRYVLNDLEIPAHPDPSTNAIYVHTLNLLTDGRPSGHTISINVHPSSTTFRDRNVSGFATDTYELPCKGGTVNIVLNFDETTDMWQDVLVFDINAPVSQPGFAGAGLTDWRVITDNYLAVETTSGDWQKGIDIILDNMPIPLEAEDIIEWGFSVPPGQGYTQLNIGVNVNGDGFAIRGPKRMPWFTEDHFGSGIHRLEYRVAQEDLEQADGARTVGIRFYPFPPVDNARLQIHRIRITRPPASWLAANPFVGEILN